MTLENAIITAAQIAAKVDELAYVWHNEGNFQCLCMPWGSIPTKFIPFIHSIVTPSGDVFEWQREVRK